jgi:hypothetical protein
MVLVKVSMVEVVRALILKRPKALDVANNMSGAFPPPRRPPYDPRGLSVFLARVVPVEAAETEQPRGILGAISLATLPQGSLTTALNQPWSRHSTVAVLGQD